MKGTRSAAWEFVLIEFFRKRFSGFKKNIHYRQDFILSFILTYAITVCIALLALFLELDANPVSTFHNCQLNKHIYIHAKMIEAIIPTTITFCCVSFLFQMSPQKSKTSATFMLICISLLAALHIAFLQISDPNVMFVALVAALILDAVPVAISYGCYAEPEALCSLRKQEINDGAISG